MPSDPISFGLCPFEPSLCICLISALDPRHHSASVVALIAACNVSLDHCWSTFTFAQSSTPRLLLYCRSRGTLIAAKHFCTRIMQSYELLRLFLPTLHCCLRILVPQSRKHTQQTLQRICVHPQIPTHSVHSIITPCVVTDNMLPHTFKQIHTYIHTSVSYTHLTLPTNREV